MPEQTAAQIVNAYLDDDDRVLVVLKRVGDDVVKERLRPEWVSYHLRSEFEAKPDTYRALRHSQAVRSVREEGRFVRVEWADKWMRRFGCFGKRDERSPLQLAGIQSFEADISPIRRYLTDHNVVIARPRVVYLDIEADSRVTFVYKERARILSWAIADENGHEEVQVLTADTDEAERDLLVALWRCLARYDQVRAWSGSRYDFPVIFARTKRAGLDVDARRWLWLDYLVMFQRMNQHAAESGEEKQSFSLGSITSALLKDTKDDFDAAFTWEAWTNSEGCGGRCKRCRECLARYNLKDTTLLPRLETKTGYGALFATIAEVCRVFPDDRGLLPTQQMDGFMLQLGREHGIHFASKVYREGSEFQNDDEQYEGATVIPPQNKGIRRNVHVCDFKSLYPTIILTWNMSPETKFGHPSPKRPHVDEAPFPVALAPRTGQRFRSDVVGSLPLALRVLIERRAEFANRKASLPPGTPEWYDADRRSNAFKVAANSFYGVVGSPYSRYYDPDVAEAITTSGAWLLVDVVTEAARERGMEVEYGDTDSAFIAGVSEEAFRAFVKECNEVIIPAKIAALGCAVNEIRLDYEKEFLKLVFISAKRYVGYFKHYKGKPAKADSKPEVKGLEYKRGDSARLGRQLQQELIERFRHDDDPTWYREAIGRALEYATSGELTYEDVVVSKKLTKEIGDYGKEGKSVPAHVRIAKILGDRGRDVGAGVRIEYVVVDGSKSPAIVIPGEDYAGESDRWHLWEKHVYPPSQRFVEALFPDRDWKTGLENIRPKKLGGKSKPLAGQLSLDVSGRESPGQAPFIISILEGSRRYLSDLEVVLKRHPGLRPVEVRVLLPSGSVAVVPLWIWVSGSEKLLSELARAEYLARYRRMTRAALLRP